ncbi:hypothetical protein Trydic_g6787 [Trypoxylus dichotomus]
MIGVAQSTVYRAIKEYTEKGQVTPSKKISGRHSLIADYDETYEVWVPSYTTSDIAKDETPRKSLTKKTFINNHQLPTY